MQPTDIAIELTPLTADFFPCFPEGTGVSSPRLRNRRSNAADSGGGADGANRDAGLPGAAAPVRAAERAADPAHLRRYPLHLCHASFPRPCPRQCFGRGDGRDAALPEAGVAVAAGRGRPLCGAADAPEPRLLGALRAASVPLDPARNHAARARPVHPLPVHRSFRRDAAVAEPVRHAEELSAGTLQLLGRMAARRLAPDDAAPGRMDPRLHRAAFLAEAPALLPEHPQPAPRRRRTGADAGAPRDWQGGRTIQAIAQDPAWRADELKPQQVGTPD